LPTHAVALDLLQRIDLTDTGLDAARIVGDGGEVPSDIRVLPRGGAGAQEHPTEEEQRDPKRGRHKEIYPYLRYGFVLGGRKPLTNKFFTHNQGFDFAMFVLHLRTDGENLVRMIKRKINHAETLIDVMRNDRATFKRYERNIVVRRQ
jgi:hypothetical protein